jgi:hypothetical protein
MLGMSKWRVLLRLGCERPQQARFSPVTPRPRCTTRAPYNPGAALGRVLAAAAALHAGQGRTD